MESSRVVVGVDGSEGSTVALRFAVGEARLRDAVLQVVYAWRLPLAVAAPEASALGVPLIPELTFAGLRDASVGTAEALVDDALAGIDTSGVHVERTIVEAAPAQALVEVAGGADLLVVGSRGRGGFAGVVLGSVSQQCAHHAPCPVVIVPHERDR
jgi:nucleotide-binding universal stress UspA family protein